MGVEVKAIRLVCLACLLITAAAGSAVAEERYAVIVNGATGGEKYAAQQKKWREDLDAALKKSFLFNASNIVVFSEEGTSSLTPTAENVRGLFADLRRRVTRDDLLLVVLIGHGNFDGTDAKFNLVGPDLTAREWRGLLDAIPGRSIIVNTTESSFPFLEELSRRGRVVITATDSPAQRFATVFPGYFIQALGNAGSDLDKNGRVSIWETFRAASAAVKQHYEQLGQLSTERAIIDDNGDGIGREADDPGPDGTVAVSVYLDAGPGPVAADAAIANLYRERATIEAQLETLKSRRELISPGEYEAQMEKLLIELARISQRIRQGS